MQAEKRAAEYGGLTSFSLFLLEENRGPRKIKDFVGRGGRNGAERSPRRQAGTEWAEFLPTTWGGAKDQPSLATNPPRPPGRANPSRIGKPQSRHFKESML